MSLIPNIINPYGHNPSTIQTQQALIPPSASGTNNVNVVSGPPPVANALGAVPFIRAAKRFGQSGNTFSGQAFSTQFNNSAPAYGYMRGLAFTVQVSAGTSTGAVVAYEDAPFSAVTNLTIQDRSGAPLTSLDGFSWYMAQLYGGYSIFRPDLDTNTSVFSNVQLTSGAGAGNFKFILPYMLEFGAQGQGVLPNDNAQAAYNFTMQFASGVGAATGPLYVTAPTTPGTLSGGVELLARLRPGDKDPATQQPNLTDPPGLGLFQTWSLQTWTLASGLNLIPVTRVGNVWRNLVLIYRSATNGTRATAETDGTLPTTHFIKWDSANLRVLNTATMRLETFMQTNIPTFNGVVAILFTPEAGNVQGETDGDGYIPTALGANMIIQVTNSGPANGKLTILLNDIVVPAGVNLYEVPQMAHGHPAVMASAA